MAGSHSTTIITCIARNSSFKPSTCVCVVAEAFLVILNLPPFRVPTSTSCQFVVKDGGNYVVHAADPDLLVDWKDVQQVVRQSLGLVMCTTLNTTHMLSLPLSRPSSFCPSLLPSFLPSSPLSFSLSFLPPFSPSLRPSLLSLCRGYFVMRYRLVQYVCTHPQQVQGLFFLVLLSSCNEGTLNTLICQHLTS